MRGTLNFYRIPLNILFLEDIRNDSQPATALDVLLFDDVAVEHGRPAITQAIFRQVRRSVRRQQRRDLRRTRAAIGGDDQTAFRPLVQGHVRIAAVSGFGRGIRVAR